MVTASPPVSPKVVAATLMTQKPSVTAGTLLSVSRSPLVMGLPTPWATLRREGVPGGRKSHQMCSLGIRDEHIADFVSDRVPRSKGSVTDPDHVEHALLAHMRT